MTDDEKTLRAVECQILDRQHLKYPLLQRNLNDAIAAVLQCYGDVIRGLRNGTIPKNSDDAKAQTANEGFRGLAHCIRWLQAKCPRLLIVPSSDQQQLQTDAMEFLRWGVKYDPLYNQHVAYSRKINGTRGLDAQVDEKSRFIEFLPRKDIDPRFFVSQVEARKRDDERQAKLYSDARFAELSTRWFQSVHSGQRDIRFDDTQIASSGALDVASEWLRGSCLPEMLDSDSLGPFSAGSLRRFLAALHVASLFRVWLEDHADRRGDVGMPQVLTHVLSWTWNELHDWLNSITNLPESEIDRIIGLFTFHSEPERMTLAHKPLILGADNRVFLSPRLFLSLPLSQMVVGALNLNPTTRAAYDAVSNTIERRIVEKIAAEIRRGPLQNTVGVHRKTFTLPDRSTIEPDIVLLSLSTSELLVVDVKNSTPPFGVGDIACDLSEWDEKWTPQLNQYVNAFRDHPQILGQHFGKGATCSPQVFGVILLRWPFPVPVAMPATFGAIDWPTLQEKLARDSECGSISELCRWIRERPDVRVVNKLQWTKREIQVEDWRYCYSVLSVSGPDNAG